MPQRYLIYTDLYKQNMLKRGSAVSSFPVLNSTFREMPEGRAFMGKRQAFTAIPQGVPGLIPA
jgi:hypothetical protein